MQFYWAKGVLLNLVLQFVCRMWNAPSSHVNIFFAAAICDSNRQLRDVCLYCKPSHGEVCSFLLSMVYKTYARNTMVFFFSCSFLVNGKGVERRTNVSLVCRFFFFFIGWVLQIILFKSTSIIFICRTLGLNFQQIFLKCLNMEQIWFRQLAIL